MHVWILPRHITQRSGISRTHVAKTGGPASRNDNDPCFALAQSPHDRPDPNMSQLRPIPSPNQETNVEKPSAQIGRPQPTVLPQTETPCRRLWRASSPFSSPTRKTEPPFPLSKSQNRPQPHESHKLPNRKEGLDPGPPCNLDSNYYQLTS